MGPSCHEQTNNRKMKEKGIFYTRNGLLLGHEDEMSLLAYIYYIRYVYICVYIWFVFCELWTGIWSTKIPYLLSKYTADKSCPFSRSRQISCMVLERHRSCWSECKRSVIISVMIGSKFDILEWSETNCIIFKYVIAGDYFVIVYLCLSYIILFISV